MGSRGKPADVCPVCGGAAPIAVWSLLEEERSRIARELHDETGQALAALLLGMTALLERLSGTAERERVGDLIFNTSSTIESVRRLLRGLRPLSLEQAGLASALTLLVRDFKQSHGIDVDLHVALPLDARFQEEVEITIFRFVQEALSNVARHSRASRVSVVLAASDGELRALVEDNGSGFTSSPESCSFGLAGLRERVRALSGRVEIESAPGRTTLNVALPAGVIQ